MARIGNCRGSSTRPSRPSPRSWKREPMSFTSTRVAPSPCPNCGHVLDAATSESALPPEPGDITVCVGCSTILVFEDGMKLALPSPALLDELIAGHPRLV